MANQAITLLKAYLTEQGFLRQRQLLTEAEQNPDRIITTSGDDALEGVGVSFAAIRRVTLLVDDTGTAEGAYVRAEGPVEAITLNQPSTVDPMWPITLTTPGGVIPGAAPLHYAQCTAVEVKALPGFDQFWPGLVNLMIAKAQEALTPPPPESFPVPNVVGMDQATAEAAIMTGGLVVGTVTQAADAVVVAGNVISQDPVAGVEAPSATPVNLVVSTGLPPVP